MTRLRAWTLSALAAATSVLIGCDNQAQMPAQGAPSEVQVLSVNTEPFALTEQLPGRVEAVRVAEVRARVAGIVLKQNFVEGAQVKAGDVLFQIDPAPLKAAVLRAEGELAKAEAQLFEAQALISRYQPLVKIEAISQQEFDSASAALRSAKAVQQAAQADLQTAKLNLSYASVTAPISGRIGRALVTEGALVGQGDATLMARIQQIDSVFVDFTQPAAEALRLRQALSNGEVSGSEAALKIQVEGTNIEREGRLLFTDVSVDPGTGQLTLRGLFDNPDGLLLPGMFVRVLITQAENDQALFIPQRAVSFDAQGQAQVMLANADNQVELRKIRTGLMQAGRWQVLDGLEVGDRVIVAGLGRTGPGQPVVVREVELAPVSSR